VLNEDEIKMQHIMKVEVVQYLIHSRSNYSEPITDVNEDDFEMCVQFCEQNQLHLEEGNGKHNESFYLLSALMNTY
jgi:hypothetical protein